jgi:hypothetical protein
MNKKYDLITKNISDFVLHLTQITKESPSNIEFLR